VVGIQPELGLEPAFRFFCKRPTGGDDSRGTAIVWHVGRCAAAARAGLRMYSQITRRSDGLTDRDSPRLLHACADPAGYRSFTLGRFKPDALALFDERGSGLLLADGSGSY
jgi:hypothetical protein